MYKDYTLNLRKLIDQGASGVELAEEMKSQIKKTSGLASKYYQGVPDPGEGQEEDRQKRIEREIRTRYETEYKKSSDYLLAKEELMASLDQSDSVVTPEVQPEPKLNKGLGSRPEKTSVEDFIASFEISKPQDSYKAYWDNKQWSIGFGTKAKNKDEVITHEEAMSRLKKETAKAREFVLKIKEKHGYDFTNNQIDALTSFTYNLGPTNLNKLTENGTRGIEEISDMILEYNQADGKVQEGLVKRRKAEYELFNDL